MSITNKSTGLGVGLGDDPIDPNTNIALTPSEARRALLTNESPFSYSDIQHGYESKAKQRVLGDNPYHPEFTPEYQQQLLHEKQSFGGQLFNSLVVQGLLGQIVGGTIQGIGDMLDLPRYLDMADGTEYHFGSWLSDLGTDLIDWTQEAAPIYESPYAKKFDPTSASWWLTNLPSVMSTASLLIPAEGALRIMGKVGEIIGLAAKWGKLSRKARWILSSAVEAGFSRDLESMMEAVGDGQQIRQQLLDRGVDPLTVVDMAAKGMSNSYKKNWILYLQELPQYMFFGNLVGRGPAKIRAVSEESSKVLKELGLPMGEIFTNKALGTTQVIAGEFGEEFYQALVNWQSQSIADNSISGKPMPTLFKVMKDNLDNGDLWTNAFFGAIGGAFMLGLAPVFKYKSRAKANETRIKEIRQWPAKLQLARERYEQAVEMGDENEIRAATADFVATTVLASHAHGNIEYYKRFLEQIKSDPDKIATNWNIPAEDMQFYKDNPKFVDQLLEQTKKFEKNYNEYLKEARKRKDIPGKGKQRLVNEDIYAQEMAYHNFMYNVHKETMSILEDDMLNMDINKDVDGEFRFEDLSETGKQLLKLEYQKAALSIRLNGRKGKGGKKGSLRYLLRTLEKTSQDTAEDKAAIKEIKDQIDDHVKRLNEIKAQIKDLHKAYSEEEQKQDEGFNPDGDKLVKYLNKLNEYENAKLNVERHENMIKALRDGSIFKAIFPEEKPSKTPKKKKKGVDTEIKEDQEIEPDEKTDVVTKEDEGEGPFKVGGTLEFEHKGDVKRGKITNIELATKDESGNDIEPDIANDLNVATIQVLDDEGLPTGEVVKLPFSEFNVKEDVSLEEGALSSSQEGDEVAGEVELTVSEVGPQASLSANRLSINFLDYAHYDTNGNLVVRDKALEKHLLDPNNTLAGAKAEFYVDLNDKYLRKQLTEFRSKVGTKRKAIIDKLLKGEKITESEVETLISLVGDSTNQLLDEIQIKVRIKDGDKTFDNDLTLTPTSRAFSYVPPGLSEKEAKDYLSHLITAARAKRKEILKTVLTSNKIVVSSNLSKERGNVSNKIGKKANVAEVLNKPATEVKLAVSKSAHGKKELSSPRLYVAAKEAIKGTANKITTIGGVYAIVEDTPNGIPYALKLNKVHISREHAAYIYDALIRLGRSDVVKVQGKYKRRAHTDRERKRNYVGDPNLPFPKDHDIQNLKVTEFLNLFVNWGYYETSPDSPAYAKANLSQELRDLMESKQLYLWVNKQTGGTYLVYGKIDAERSNMIDVANDEEVNSPITREKFIQWLTANKTYPVHLVNGKVNLELNGQFLTATKDKNSAKPFWIKEKGKAGYISRKPDQTYSQWLIENNLVTTDAVRDDNGNLFHAPGLNLGLATSKPFELKTEEEVEPTAEEPGTKPKTKRKRVTKKKVTKLNEEGKDANQQAKELLEKIAGQKLDDDTHGRVAPKDYTDYDVQDLTAEIKFVKQRLGVKDVQVVKDFIRLAKGGKSLFGLYTADGITLYEAAERGTVYHEAFHRFSIGILRPGERKLLYRTARALYGMSEATDNEVEERLAEEFRHYVLTRQQLEHHSKIREFFDRIIKFIESLFIGRNRIATNDVDMLFDQLYSGKLRRFRENTNEVKGKYGRLMGEGDYKYISTRRERTQMAKRLAHIALAENGGLSFGNAAQVDMTKALDWANKQIEQLSTLLQSDSLDEDVLSSLKHTRNLLQDAVDNIDDMYKQMRRYFTQIGLREVIDEKQRGDDVDDENASIKNDWDMASYETDLKDNALGHIKFVLSAVPSSKPSVTNPLVDYVDFNVLWSYLVEDLHDATSVQEMIDRLDKIAVQEDRYEYTIVSSKLKENTKDGKIFRNQFYASVRSFKNDFVNVTFRSTSNNGVRFSFTDSRFYEAQRSVRGMFIDGIISNNNLFVTTKEGRVISNKELDKIANKVKTIQAKLDSATAEQSENQEFIDNYIESIKDTLNDLNLHIDDETIGDYLYNGVGDTIFMRMDTLTMDLYNMLDEETLSDPSMLYRNDVISTLSKHYVHIHRDSENTSVFGPKGNKHFVFSQLSLATEIAQALARDNNLASDLIERVYNSRSRILNLMLPKKGATAQEIERANKFRESFGLKTLNLFRAVGDSSDRSRHIRRMSPIETALMKMNAIQNGYLPFPVMADRKSYYFMSFGEGMSPLIQNAIKTINGDRYEFSDEVVDLMYDYYLDEQDAIDKAKAVREAYLTGDKETKDKIRPTLIKNYHYTGNFNMSNGNAYSFRDFAGFNEHMTKSDFVEKLNTTLSNRLNDEIEFLSSIDIVAKKADGELWSDRVNTQWIDKYRNEEKDVGIHAALVRLIGDTMINMEMSVIETQKIFMADPAMFKANKQGDVYDDFYKRMFGLASSGNKFSVDAENGPNTYNVAVIATQKLMSSWYKNIYDRHVDLYYNVLVEKETEVELSKEKQAELRKRAEDLAAFGTEEYKSVDPTDGQMLISAELYKNFMQRLGLWTNDINNAYNILQSDRKLSSREEIELYNIALNPLKTVYMGHHNINGLNVLIYDKMSMGVLFRRLVAGRPLEEVLDRMEAKGKYEGYKKIHAFKYDSAVKVGQLPSFKLFSDIKSTKDIATAKVNDLSNVIGFEQSIDNLRRQVVTDVHDVREFTIGTQVFKVAIADIEKSKPYGKYKSGQDLLDSVIRARNALSNLGMHKVNAKLSISNGVIDNSRLIEILRRDAEKANKNDDFISALRVDDDNNMYLNLDSFPDKKWIYSRLMSIITKETIDLNYPGNQLIQQSDFGMGSVESDSNLNFVRFNSKDGSVIEMEARVSVRMFKHFFPKYKSLTYNAIKEIVESQKIQALGYRVPTQGQSSVTVMTIKEILPEASGDVIFLPLEFTALTGSDFDIDKLFVMLHNYRFDKKTNKLVKVAYDESDNVDGRYERKLEELYRIYLKYSKSPIGRELYENLTRSGGKVIERHKLSEILDLKRAASLEEPLGISDIRGHISAIQAKLDALEDLYYEAEDNNKQSILNNINKTLQELSLYENYFDYTDGLINAVIKSSDAYKFIEDTLNRHSVKISMDEFKNWSIEEQNTEKALKNKILDDFINVLTDKKHIISTTTTLESLKSKLQERAGIFEYNYKLQSARKAKPLAAGTLSYQTQKQYEYGLSKGQVAPWALSNVSHIISQHVNLKMNVDDIFNSNLFPESVMDISKIKGIDDINITMWHSAIMTGFVDFIKDPYLAKLNTNNITTPVLILMLRAGLGIKSFDFINQPIIRDYVALAINNHGQIKTFDEPLKEMRQVYVNRLNNLLGAKQSSFDLKSELAKISIDDFFKGNRLMLDTSPTTKQDVNFYLRQIKVLDLFEAFEKEAAAVTNVAILSRIDTKQFGSTPAELAFLLAKIDDVLVSGKFINIDKLLDYNKEYESGDSFLPTLIKNSINQVTNLLKDKSLYSTQGFLYAVRDILQNSRFGLPGRVSSLNNISEELMSYIQGLFFSDESNGLSMTPENLNKILYDPDNSLFSMLAQIKSGDHPLSDKLKDNKFIQALILDNVDDIPVRHQIKMPYAALDDILQTEDYIDDFNQLLTSGDPELEKLATTIFVYSYYTSGFRNRLRAFFTYFPMSMFKEFKVKDNNNPGERKVVSFDAHIGDMLKKLNDPAYSAQFLVNARREIMRNNWWDNYLVTPMRLDDFQLVETNIKGQRYNFFATLRVPKEGDAEAYKNYRARAKDLFLGSNQDGQFIFKSHVMLTSEAGDSYLLEYMGYSGEEAPIPIYRIIAKKGFRGHSFLLKEYGLHKNSSAITQNNYYAYTPFEEDVFNTKDPVYVTDESYEKRFNKAFGPKATYMSPFAQVVYDTKSLGSMIYDKAMDQTAEDIYAFIDEEMSKRQARKKPLGYSKSRSTIDLSKAFGETEESEVTNPIPTVKVQPISETTTNKQQSNTDELSEDELNEGKENKNNCKK